MFDIRRRVVTGAICVLITPAWSAVAMDYQDTGAKQCFCQGRYQMKPSGYSDCRSYCESLQGVGATAPTYDPGGQYGYGARQDYQGQQAEAEAERKRKEEMERHRKEDEEREHQRQFDADKQDLEDHLKVESDSDLNLKGYDAYEDSHQGKVGLKGEGKTRDTEIKKKAPAGVQRHWGDIKSPVIKAWSQLYCGASLFGNDVEAARLSVSQGDLERVRYLADQAIGALNGLEFGEPCPAAPPMPRPESRMNLPHDLEVKLYTALTQETQKQAARLVDVNKGIAKQKKKAQEAKRVLAQNGAGSGEAGTELKLKTPDDPKDAGARAAAEAALKAAQAALAKAQADKDSATRRLDELKAAGAQAVKNPDAIDSLYAAFSSPEPSQTGGSR